MAQKLIDITGNRYGNVVVKRWYDKQGKYHVWECECDCGNICYKQKRNLLKSFVHSCGCRERAGKYNGAAYVNKMPTPEYNSYHAMMQRCYYEKSNKYKNYGGRGIKVCEAWREKDGFGNFLKDLGKRPTGCTLDRINSDGDYTPDNCKWSTYSEQNYNRRKWSEANKEVNNK